MIDMNEAVQRLCIHEGIRLQLYRCSAGKLTIGVGRNIEDNPITAEEEKVVGDWHHGITKQGAFYLLRHDIIRVQNNCEKSIPFFKNLDDERQYVLLDMSFNLGISGLLKFKKMLSNIGVGNYRQAAVELLNSNYAKQVGNRAHRLARVLQNGQWKI